MAKNSFKFQGIANGKAVDIQQYYDNKKPKGIVLSTKSSKGINKPVCLFLARALKYSPAPVYADTQHSCKYEDTCRYSWAYGMIKEKRKRRNNPTVMICRSRLGELALKEYEGLFPVYFMSFFLFA
jgi:hypothetical protein